MNQAQYKAAWAIINKCGLQSQKDNIVAGISQGRTSSMRELSHEESLALISYLKTLDVQPKDEAADKMRNKIFYYAHMMNWTKVNKYNKVVADGKRIDEWMIKYSYLKKKLNRYSYEELPKLVYQVEMLYKSHLKKT